MLGPTALWLMLLPTLAQASESGAEPSGESPIIVIIVGVVAVAYLLTHFVVDRLQQRFLFVTGLEYIALGAMLGLLLPQAFGNLTPLAPVIALAAGAVGLYYGMELDLRRVFRQRDDAFRLVAFETVTTGAAVSIAVHWLFMTGWLVEVTNTEAWIAAAALGCTAAAQSTSAIDLLARRTEDTTELLSLLRRSTQFGDLLAICAFGIVFCAFHEGTPATSEPPDTAEWILITLGLGVSLGALFTVFLDDDDDDNSRFLALVGIIAFASGAAFFLNLSVLWVNLVLGVVLVNTNSAGEKIRETLAGTQRPMVLVLLVFAGVLWHPVPPLPALAVAVCAVVVRAVGKAVGCWLASLGTGLRPDLARGLLAQGDVAVAMAISLRIVYEGPAIDLAYTGILASVVAFELVAPRALRGLLVDTGELGRTLAVGE